MNTHTRANTSFSLSGEQDVVGFNKVYINAISTLISMQNYRLNTCYTFIYEHWTFSYFSSFSLFRSLFSFPHVHEKKQYPTKIYNFAILLFHWKLFLFYHSNEMNAFLCFSKTNQIKWNECYTDVSWEYTRSHCVRILLFCIKCTLYDLGSCSIQFNWKLERNSSTPTWTHHEYTHI